MKNAGAFENRHVKHCALERCDGAEKERESPGAVWMSPHVKKSQVDRELGKPKRLRNFNLDLIRKNEGGGLRRKRLQRPGGGKGKRMI